MFTDYQASVLFNENYHAIAPVVINQGGTNSGKTYAITLVLFCIACENANLVITIAGQDLPNLKSGVLRDALRIYAGSQHLQNLIISYNKSEHIFEFNNGTAKYTGADSK